MNLDQLNKQQVILLALLVSIVTSIATGITIISLVGQSPVQTVNQTVNRVIEKTIERVVEEDVSEDSEIQVPEKEIVTVVVNEEDLTIDAIENNSKSIVRIFNSETGDFVSIGLIIDKNGTLYAPNVSYNSRDSYIGEFVTGSFALNLIEQGDDNEYLIMEPNVEDEEFEFIPIEIGESESLKLGQSVISLSGINSNSVSTGIVTSIDNQEGISINTSVKEQNVIKGSILLNLNGKVVGIKTGKEILTTTFSPSSIIKLNI